MREADLFHCVMPGASRFRGVLVVRAQKHAPLAVQEFLMHGRGARARRCVLHCKGRDLRSGVKARAARGAGIFDARAGSTSPPLCFTLQAARSSFGCKKHAPLAVQEFLMHGRGARARRCILYCKGRARRSGAKITHRYIVSTLMVLVLPLLPFILPPVSTTLSPDCRANTRFASKRL